MHSLSNAVAGRIGENIREQREGRGLAQDELARRAALDEHALWRVERGTMMPTVLNLVQLADALECRPSELLHGVSAALGDE